MNYRPWLALLTISLTPPLLALNEKNQEAIQRLEASLVAEVAAEKPAESPDGHRRENIKSSMLPRIRELLARPDSPQFLDSIGQFTAYFNSEDVLKNLGLLQKELRAEREASEQATLAGIQELLTRAGKSVREAKNPAELDDLITELGKYRQRGDRGPLSEELRNTTNQIEPTLQFVTNWQNYLAARVAGDGEAARNALQNISGSSNSPYLIPRSQILALLKPAKMGSSTFGEDTFEEDIRKIIDDTKTLSDIDSALIALRKLQKSRRNSNGNDLLNPLLGNLQSIDRVYQDFNAGLSVSIESQMNYSNSSEIGNALVSRLKAELLLLVLPRYVGAPQDSKAKPGEDVTLFLQRLASEARERGDGNVGLQVREALRVLKRGGNFGNVDTLAFTNYIARQNQETAGQPLLAVISYQTALRSGSDLIPAKIIGERLAAIQATHPAEYEAAMDRFLNPPPPRFDQPRQSPPMVAQPGQHAPLLQIPPLPLTAPTPSTTPPPTEKPQPNPTPAGQS